MTEDAGLDPDIVISLLRKFEWTITSELPDRYQVWRNKLMPTQEILLPIDPEKGDYKQLLRRAFRTLVYEHGAEIEREAVKLADNHE